MSPGAQFLCVLVVGVAVLALFAWFDDGSS